MYVHGSQPQRTERAGDPIRDRYGLDLLHAFIGAGTPVFGVCRGTQPIDLFHRGALVQDIPIQWPGAVAHQDTERCDHQCVDRLGDGLVAEAIRRPGTAFALGVQWHPEFHLTPQKRARGLFDSAPMMQGFLDAARDRSGRHRPAAV